MSALTFGGQSAMSSGSTVTDLAFSGLPLAAVGGVGPLPSAAASYINVRHDLEAPFATAPFVRELEGWREDRAEVRLFACGMEQPDAVHPIVAWLDAEGTRWFLELRRQIGWDTGLAHTGVQIRRWQRTPVSNPVMEIGPEFSGEIVAGEGGEGDADWTSPKGEFTITVIDVSPADAPWPWVDVVATADRNTRRVSLSAVTTTSSPSVAIAHQTITVDDECLGGTYGVDVMSTDRIVRVSATTYQMERPTLTWTINGKPVTTDAAPPSFPGRIPSPDGTTKPRAVTPLDLATTDVALQFTVAAASGDVDLSIECAASDSDGTVRAATQVGVSGATLRYDQHYLDRFARCVQAEVPLVQGPAPNLGHGPSDGPEFNRIFGGLQALPAGAAKERLVTLAAQRFAIDPALAQTLAMP